MADDAHKLTDKTLEEMERHLSAIYSRASEEIGESWKKYLEDSGKEIENLQSEYEDAKAREDDEEARRLGKELSQAKREITLQNKRFKDLTEQTAEQLLHVNETATAYINGELPEVYALNYNALEDQTGEIKGYSFALTDADTVRNLATKDETLLPYKTVNGKKDIRWNTKKINAEVLQGILQGESMSKIAGRLAKIESMNEKSAIRNARTMVTSAENKGRQDSYEKAQSDGIKLQKEWLSSDQPGRTRDWHMPGAFVSLTVNTDESFENSIGKIRYPGDPTANGANVWNCRCTMIAKVIGFAKRR